MAAYITFTLEEKVELLRQLERRRAVGPVSANQSGGGVRNEFKVNESQLRTEIAELIASILADPDFTSDHELYDALQGARRGGQTQVVFG